MNRVRSRACQAWPANCDLFYWLVIAPLKLPLNGLQEKAAVSINQRDFIMSVLIMKQMTHKHAANCRQITVNGVN